MISVISAISEFSTWPLNTDVFTIIHLETELNLKLLICYAIACIYYFKYLFSMLLNSQEIYWHKNYGKIEFFTDIHILKSKCKFQFLRKA